MLSELVYYRNRFLVYVSKPIPKSKMLAYIHPITKLAKTYKVFKQQSRFLENEKKKSCSILMLETQFDYYQLLCDIFLQFVSTKIVQVPLLTLVLGTDTEIWFRSQTIQNTPMLLSCYGRRVWKPFHSSFFIRELSSSWSEV